MGMLRAIALAIGVTMLAGMPAEAQTSDFGNESIIKLTKAGIGPGVLLAKIASLPCSYDVSTDSIVALKGAGVADEVIAAMVDRCFGASRAQGATTSSSDPSAKRSAGLYIDQGTPDAHQLVKIRPSSASGGRATGNGSLLFPYRLKLAVPRATAQTSTSKPLPHFYFYFESDDSKVGDFGTSGTISAQSPSEFSLVKFKEKDGQREMVVAKQKMFGASIGIDPKDAMQFSVEETGDNIFSVVPSASLPVGQYAFVLKTGGDAYRIYDFSIVN